MNKRSFIKNMALIGLGTSASLKSLAALTNQVGQSPSHKVAANEDFWATIRGGYKL